MINGVQKSCSHWIEANVHTNFFFNIWRCSTVKSPLKSSLQAELHFDHRFHFRAYSNVNKASSEQRQCFQSVYIRPWRNTVVPAVLWYQQVFVASSRTWVAETDTCVSSILPGLWRTSPEHPWSCTAPAKQQWDIPTWQLVLKLVVRGHGFP